MEYLLHILVITGIYIILTLSLNLILGYTGLPAFGHAERRPSHKRGPYSLSISTVLSSLVLQARR